MREATRIEAIAEMGRTEVSEAAWWQPAPRSTCTPGATCPILHPESREFVALPRRSLKPDEARLAPTHSKSIIEFDMENIGCDRGHWMRWSSTIQRRTYPIRRHQGEHQYGSISVLTRIRRNHRWLGNRPTK